MPHLTLQAPRRSLSASDVETAFTDDPALPPLSGQQALFSEQQQSSLIRGTPRILFAGFVSRTVVSFFIILTKRIVNMFPIKTP